MDSKQSIALAVGGCLILLTARQAFAVDGDDADSGNPYAVISERNVFHLNPPPPPPAPEDTAPKEEPSTIKITGIVKINGTLRALFVSQPKNAKDTPTYFNLAEGEREGILEVVRIHEDDQKIDILNSGKPVTLTFKNDTLARNEGTPPPGSVPEAGAPPAPGAPPVPGGLSRHLPTPGLPSVPGAKNPGGLGNSPFAFPTRARRTTPGGASPTPASQ